MATLRDWYERGQYMEARGHRIFFQEAGRGKAETLLLLHGFPTSSWDWHKVWDELALQYHLLAPDFLGFGYSDKPVPHDYLITEQADLALALLRHCGVGRYHLLAHDYGDTVAQELLARERESAAPLRIQSVVLLNGGLFPEVHRPLPVQRLLMGPLGPYLAPLMGSWALRRNFQKIFGPETQPSTQEIDEWWSLLCYNNGKAALPGLLQYMAEREAHRDRWVNALIESPVMVRLIDGQVDPISGGHIAERYRKLVKDADVHLLRGIGHYPQTEAPKEVLAHCWAFWEQL
jgi:pimeloyl-ACP methyl ester carboxylesterase